MPDQRPIGHLTTLSGSLLITFRELRSTYVAIGLFAVVTLAWIMLTFAMSLDVVEGSVAALRIFGLDVTPIDRTRDAETGSWISQALSLEKFTIGIQQIIFGVAYLLGTFLGLFAAVPVSASTLEPGRIDLLLSKPVSRTRLLAGHVFGILLVVLAVATYLVIAIWIVISVKTGVRVDNLLWAIPIITGMFAVMYAAALLMIVHGAGAPLALILTYGLIFLSLFFQAKDQILPQLGPVAAATFNVLYVVLPNFIEGIGIMAKLSEPSDVERWYPLALSAGFGTVCYVWAAVRFNRRDF